jgi:outer membrane protein assembly factor BamD
MKNRLRLFATLSLTAALLAGCASEKAKDETLAAADLYTQIQANMEAGNYKTAVERLNTLQARFPFDDFGTQAQLDLIYANYMNRDNDAAVDAADRFIREHPRHANVDYAYYMKGVAYFDNEVDFLQRWFGHDNYQRDPSNSQKSFEAFSLLIEKYPDSRYLSDARQRMVFLRERLADFDWVVADWYMRRGAWVSALQRSYNIVQRYPQTPRVQDALQIMYSCYKKLGMDDLAATTQKVLETNFPGTPLEYTPRGPV